jgi:hypothetical protein
VHEIDAARAHAAHVDLAENEHVGGHQRQMRDYLFWMRCYRERVIETMRS